MSAVVVKAEKEKDVLGWGTQIIAALRTPQLQSLHLRKLGPDKQHILCSLLASLDVRLFVFISHKKNMQGYRNLHAEAAKINKTAWFYAWCSKLLMESVTDFCGRRSRRDYGESRVVRCEFSTRGGVT